MRDPHYAQDEVYSLITPQPQEALLANCDALVRLPGGLYRECRSRPAYRIKGPTSYVICPAHRHSERATFPYARKLV